TTLILYDLDPWTIAVGLAAAMVVAWRIGWHHGRRRASHESHGHESKFSDATLALLGLLLGFTFSLAIGKYNQRRLMVVADSNAIGDLFTCASLLKEPVRSQLQNLIRTYVDQRIDLSQRVDRAHVDVAIREIDDMHAHMVVLVGKAIDDGTPVVV